MRAEAHVEDDPKHGPTLVVTYRVRRRQLERRGLEHCVAFISRDVVRRVMAWKKAWT